MEKILRFCDGRWFDCIEFIYSKSNDVCCGGEMNGSYDRKKYLKLSFNGLLINDEIFLG